MQFPVFAARASVPLCSSLLVRLPGRAFTLVDRLAELLRSDAPPAQDEESPLDAEDPAPAEEAPPVTRNERRHPRPIATTANLV